MTKAKFVNCIFYKISELHINVWDDLQSLTNDRLKMKNKISIETLALFPILDTMLIELLTTLTKEEWNTQTVASLWKVKDVAAHLLDGNLRGLSISRDGYFGEKAENINSYEELVSFLNALNLIWTNAAKRLSPRILISLLKITSKEYTEHLQSLDPFGKAVFPVAWAGQDTSPNWFHIAREYSEKFLHQQQIRDAVGKQGIMTKELFHPFLDTFMYAFPYTFKNIEAENGTILSLKVTTDIGGQWNIVKTENGWSLDKNNYIESCAKITIDPDSAWKLFSKSYTSDQVIEKVEIMGNKKLAYHILKMVSVMA